MKRVVLLSAAILFFCTDSFSGPGKRRSSSEGAFRQGQNAFHVGIGFPALFYPPTDSLMYYGAVERKVSLPIQLRYEYGITENIGAGLMMAYYTSKVTVTDNTDPENVNGFDYTFFFIGARGAWHQSLGMDKLDAYGALTLGYTSASNKPFGINNVFPTYSKGFTWGFNVGANFYIIDNLGIFLEAGYGLTAVNAGISARF